MHSRIKRPALRYYGGKWQLAPWIVGNLPEHTTYVEPFGGAASVLLCKSPAFIEVYNDLSGEVVNFFRVLREQPAALFAAIDLTPYSRQEYVEAQTVTGDSVERARRLYVRSWQGRGGRPGISEPASWHFMARATRGQTFADDWCNNQHLWAVAQRLKRVQIECDDALTVIARYDSPDTLFYIDPPYVPAARNERWALTAYAHEMDDACHRALATALHAVAGSVVLSGYPSALYDELYSDWRQVRKDRNKADSAEKSTEVLWLSLNTVRQPELFA